jgi:cellulose synthase/poly-beta-1,6-N-acetylglucosamine synthase-like glycosyltransferase
MRLYSKWDKDMFKPRTVLGRWSVGLIFAFFFFLALFLIIAASGARGGDTFFSNMALALPMLLAAFCGVAAFITGLIAIIVSKERAISVMVAAVLGCNVLVFGLGEILFPH